MESINFSADNMIAIIGKRKSGKTTLVGDLLAAAHKNDQDIVVFCGSESTTRYYHNLAKRLPIAHIGNNIDHDVLNKQKNTDKHCIVVFDDLCFDAQLWKSSEMKDLLYTGRRYGISCIFAIQYVMHIPLQFRTQIDHVFVFPEPSKRHNWRIYDNFFTFHTFEEFSALMATAKKNDAIVINTSTGIMGSYTATGLYTTTDTAASINSDSDSDSDSDGKNNKDGDNNKNNTADVQTLSALSHDIRQMCTYLKVILFMNVCLLAYVNKVTC